MLTIDVGNTRFKWGIWQGESLVRRGNSVYTPETLMAELDKQLLAIQAIPLVVVCNVAGEQVETILQQWFQRHWMVSAFFVRPESCFGDVTNGYLEPARLGVDRWVAMVAAYTKYRKAVCVVDCGTAVTLDLINAGGRHLGGLIMPGLDMMRQALARDTHGIGLAEGHLCQLGKNTADAVYAGCYGVLANGLQALIRQNIALLGEDSLCVITGGGAGELSAVFDFDYTLDEDLLLYGLYIMAKRQK